MFPILRAEDGAFSKDLTSKSDFVEDDDDDDKDDDELIDKKDKK